MLPCVESMTQAHRFETLRTADELTWLPVALLSTLLFRVQSDSPDALVIAAGDDFLSRVAHRGGLREIFSETPTVLLAEQPTAAMVRGAARMHIYTVLPIEMTAHQLAAAIAATVAGFAVTLPRGPSAKIEATLETEHLTLREVEVLRLMARGHRNKQVATLLNISEHTVKFHISSVMAKLGARTRTEAVTIGVTRGLIAI